jgi:hypothetical protein
VTSRIRIRIKREKSDPDQRENPDSHQSDAKPQPRFPLRISITPEDLRCLNFKKILDSFNVFKSYDKIVRIRIQEGKNDLQKKLRNFMFEVLDVLFWELKASSVAGRA